MKKEASKKSLKWLWLAVGIAVLLAVVGVALAILLPGQEAADPETVSSELYWNVDREKWVDETGLSTRTAGEDGVYHIRFAVGGEQVELPVADKQLINFIDSMSVMGLVIDGNGVVVDAREPKSVATEVAKEMYVKEITEVGYVLNSSIAMNGMDVDVVLSAGSGVYDVDADAEVVGQISEAGLMDKVSAYANADGEITDVFIVERAVEAGVYWRVDKKYDSAKMVTTRVPDENGDYTITFAHEGQLVDLKCKDKDLVSTFDAANDIYGEFALVLDEEGYIVDEVNVGMALKGLKACNNYDVTEVADGAFTAVRNLAGSEKGKEYGNRYDADCDIFLVEDGCEAEFVGQRVDSLKKGDRITVYTDLQGKPKLIFVVKRMSASPMYYRLDKYSTKNNVSLRPQDADGYYVFDMVCQGKKVQVKTKDGYLAARIEWRNPAMMGLILREGTNIIEALHMAPCVSGWSTAFNNHYVTNITSSIITLTNPATGTTYNRMLAPGAEVYDVTGNYGIEMGSVATLQVGDKVTCARNIADELTHVYVLQRYEKNAKLYYNAGRKYNSTTKETNRTPDENGYYIFDNMLCEGKVYTLKTKDKKMANWIDSQSTAMVALTVSGDTIKGAYSHVTAFEQGNRPVNYNYVRAINKADNTFTTYYYDGDLVKENKNGTTGEYNIRKMAKDCVVYNVSTAFEKYRGEKTTLRVDDQIQTFAREDTGEIFLILVISRKVDSPLYWNQSRKYNSTKKETTREPDENGWYVFDLAVNGEVKQFKTQSKEIATKVDVREGAFALYTKGDEILNVCDPTMAKNVAKSAASYRDVVVLEGNKLVLERKRLMADDYGKTTEIQLDKNTKIYDVSTYAEVKGLKATLALGDRVTVYTNPEGKAEYIFIHFKNTHEKGHISYCEHCDKDVYWEPYSQTFYETDGHYYIPADMTSWEQKRVGADKEGKPDFEIVLDLNGKTLTAKNRLALVYSKFTILDTVGGGKVIGLNSSNGNGGVIMVTGGGHLDIRGGELTLAETAGSAKEGGIVYVGSKSSANMYGGTITGGVAKLSATATGTPVGGNVFIGNSVFNMYGGTITGGETVNGAGGNLFVNALASFNMEGGKIDGEVEFASGAKINFSGAPVIAGNGIRIDSGALVKLGKLTAGASIVVKANGVFTEATDAAETYVNYFAAEETGASISVEGNALFYNRPPADYQANLKFEEGTTKAECPDCGKVVAWTPIDQATYGEAAIPKHANSVTTVHYYLAEDITYTGTDTFFTALDSYWQNGKQIQKRSCFHLNGHNITATNGKVFQGNTGVFNIMGQGVVSGNYSAAAGTWGGGNSSVVGINVNAGIGEINLYGGTFVKAATNTQPIINIYNNGGFINIYDGATIDGTGTTGIAVDVCNGVLRMYGGKIIGGNGHAVRVNNYSATAKGSFGMLGGTITGSVEVRQETFMALTGAPVIDGAGIILAADTKLYVEDLSRSASINITASGVFTEEMEDPESCKDCFRPTGFGATIVAEGKALAYKEPVYQLNEDLKFVPGTQNAYCTVCKKTVAWTELNQENNGETAVAAPGAATSHFYLSEDITYTGTATGFITGSGTYNNNGVTAQKTLCLHLNGHNLTATQTRAVFGSTGILNILGEGTVSGNGNSATTGSTILINCQHGRGIINLYGGIYTKPETNDKSPIVYISNNGGNVNVYEEARIDGTDRSAEGGSVGAAVYGGTKEINTNQGPASFGVFGGKVIGGISVKTQYASFSMVGGEIDGKLTIENGDKLSLSGAAKVKELSVASGLLLDISGLAKEADIRVSAVGIFTKEYENVADVAEVFKPANTSDKIVIKNKALSCEKDYNKALEFADGTKNAYCAVCNKVVTWTEVNQSTNGSQGLGIPSAVTTHYYLSEDVSCSDSSAAFLTAPGTYQGQAKTACFHLNGNDLTTEARTFAGYPGVLNVMGEGVVTSRYSNSTSAYYESTGATIHMNTNQATGQINLYGGTYTKVAGSPNATVSVHDNGGTVNIYEDVVIEGGARAYHGGLNIIGAMVTGGVKVLTRTSGKAPQVAIVDATVDTVELTDGTLTIGGASKLSLAIAEGKKLTLGELTVGAEIAVSAIGEFTQANEKAADYVFYFIPAQGDSVTEKDGVLTYVKAD